MKASRRQGCLEIAGIALFALLLGAFAMSSLFRHVGQGSNAGPAANADGPPSAPPPARERIRIEVRNGSGIPGAAGRMTEFLRAAGFDVVDFGNADRFDVDRTQVLDGGRPAQAREVATALPGVPIATRSDSSPYLDVTVLIGRDLPEVLSRAAGPPPDPSWWERTLDRLPGRD
ncbi:MAG: LytR C-terminal domain-containing protein [Gemmatimonadota bacterium]